LLTWENQGLIFFWQYGKFSREHDNFGNFVILDFHGHILNICWKCPIFFAKMEYGMNYGITWTIIRNRHCKRQWNSSNVFCFQWISSIIIHFSSMTSIYERLFELKKVGWTIESLIHFFIKVHIYLWLFGYL